MKKNQRERNQKIKKQKREDAIETLLRDTPLTPREGAEGDAGPTSYWVRRDFLAFLGSSALLALLPGCSSLPGTGTGSAVQARKKFPLEGLPAGTDDEVKLMAGLSYHLVVQEGQALNSKLRFGTNNDFIAVFPFPDSDDLVMVVNHESLHPLLSFGNKTFSRDRRWIDQEMKAVGLSVVRIQKKGNHFHVVVDDPINRRLDANTSIPLISDEPIAGSRVARGTLANCAGGVTPWGTVLTCEENYADFVGERAWGEQKIQPAKLYNFQWYDHYSMPPEHYGWVVEVNPVNGECKKLTALGRMAHEGATFARAKDGRAVVYMGDDTNDQCLYKFISNRSDSLERGTLYVANIERGQWIPLDRKAHGSLEKKYRHHTELMIYTRDAAAMVGGTPLDRPEDIEIDPHFGDVYVALTNNNPKNRPHGSILRVSEKRSDPGSLEFKAKTFVLGGEETGFSSPDNLVMDKNGNLWMTTDVSGSLMGTPGYEFAGNNALFFIPLHGEWAGQALRVAVAPKDAEFTGPCFSPDFKHLFLSVQHPGELSRSLDQLTSHWPKGGKAVPQSAVIALNGETLEFLLGEKFRR